MSNLVEHYKVLEIEYGASLEDVKQAYKDLVMVWHPDRFSSNPRLQQKAQEKLKVVNEAYENLKSHHCRSQDSAAKQPQKSEHSPQKPKQSHPYSSSASSTKRQSEPKRSHSHAKSVVEQYNSIISLQEAKRILTKFKFRLIEVEYSFCTHYESGPFDLDVREDTPEVVLSVPCNSVDTFHRVLLSIPCKSAGRFHQSDAWELIHLLKANLT